MVDRNISRKSQYPNAAHQLGSLVIRHKREGKWGNCDAFIEITYHSLGAPAAAELVMDGQQKHMR